MVFTNRAEDPRYFDELAPRSARSAITRSNSVDVKTTYLTEPFSGLINGHTVDQAKAARWFKSAFPEVHTPRDLRVAQCGTLGLAWSASEGSNQVFINRAGKKLILIRLPGELERIAVGVTHLAIQYSSNDVYRAEDVDLRSGKIRRFPTSRVACDERGEPVYVSLREKKRVTVFRNSNGRTLHIAKGWHNAYVIGASHSFFEVGGSGRSHLGDFVQFVKNGHSKVIGDYADFLVSKKWRLFWTN